MNWKEIYKSKLVSINEAAKTIKSYDRVFVSPASATPLDLLNELFGRYKELEGVELHSGQLLYPLPVLTDPKFKGHIKWFSFFIGVYERMAYPKRLINAASVHLSEVDKYLHDVARVNVLVADVSVPDDEGYMYFGPMGVSQSGTVSQYAEKIVVQVNKYQPKVNGEFHRIHVKDVDYITEKDHELPELPQTPITEIEKKIATLLLPMIPDNATIQIGLGGLANAVGYGLEGKKDLSVHTEMITDSMMHLAKKGVITGTITAAFALGSNELYRFAGESKQVFLKPIHLINQVDAIAQYDNFISINACLMVDLTGQVASEGIGTRVVSSTGGASDFVRGATKSKGGKSFICLPSTTIKNDITTSNIVMSLPPSTPVTVQRSDVQYIVTEYGIADLYNRSIQDSAKALISVAHPEFRDALKEEAIKAGYLL